jgi:site-specific recombinase XerD
MNLDKMLDTYYMQNMTTIKKSTNDIHLYFVNSLKECFKNLKINNVKKLDFDSGFKIVKYFKENSNKNNHSINRTMMYLKRVLKHYDVNSSLIKFKPLIDETKSFKRIYNDDLKTIIQYLENMELSINSLVYKTVIYLLLDSGMRISELLNIKIKNIDMSDNTYKIFLDYTKTGKQRYAPFSNFSKPYIEKLISLSSNNNYLFWNFLKDRQLSKNDIRMFYKRLGDKLGIERIHSHRFRKTFASVLVENGMPIELLQNLFGHSRLSTTMIYVQYKENKALDSYNNYSNWKYA